MLLPKIDLDAHELFSLPNLTGSPERNLWMSVLERAILDFVGNSPKEIEEAREWLFDDESRESDLYSFKWVCEQLDLDSDNILSVIRAMPKRGSRRIAPWYFMREAS